MELHPAMKAPCNERDISTTFIFWLQPRGTCRTPSQANRGDHRPKRDRYKSRIYTGPMDLAEPNRNQPPGMPNSCSPACFLKQNGHEKELYVKRGPSGLAECVKRLHKYINIYTHTHTHAYIYTRTRTNISITKH